MIIKKIIRNAYIYAQATIFQKHFVIYIILLFDPIESGLCADSLFAITHRIASSTAVVHFPTTLII